MIFGDDLEPGDLGARAMRGSQRRRPRVTGPCADAGNACIKAARQRCKPNTPCPEILACQQETRRCAGLQSADDFGGFGDLGWGWKSVKGFAKKVGGGVVKIGKGSYNLARLPVAAARRVANASASVLCDKSGNPRGSDATSRNFCTAVKFKQQASLTKYLPGAAALASKVAQTKRQTDLVRQALMNKPLTGADPDVNLLADLAGADMDELSFALAEVTPGDMGAVITKENLYLFGLPLAAIGLGLYLLKRG